MKQFHKQLGVTFVELIISILVIGIAVTGILQVMTINTGSSADPMIRHQAIAIAEAYLDEILAKEFNDPDVVPGIEASRDLFDDINDYSTISNAAIQDQNGNAIAGLNGYTVTVTIADEALGPAMAQIPMADSRRVTVSVNTPDNNNVTISGYRANF